MSNNAKNVTTGKPRTAGAVWRAPLGSTLPTDAKTALDAAFVCLGYVSEDGLSNSNAPDSDTVKAWGGDPVLYTSNGKEDTFGLTLIEAANVEVLKAVYNTTNVTGTLKDGITVKANSEDAESGAWVFDLILKGGILKRIVVPEGKLTDLGEITYNDGDPVGYEMTISALPSAEYEGDTHREFIVDPTAA